MISDTILEEYRRKAIALFPFLKDVPFTILQLAAGEMLFREGEQCAQIGFLLEGQIRVYKSNSGRRELTLYRLLPGDSCALALTCALANYRHQASAVVEKPSIVATIPLNALHWLMDRSESARLFLFRMLGARLLEVLHLIQDLLYRRVDERLAQLLLELSQQHDGCYCVERSHEELAAELGSAREVVSRLLKSFERKKWISLQRRKICLDDVRALQLKARGKLEKERR